MENRYKMRTFRIVHDGKPVSPVLVPISEYKKYIEDVFDGYTAQMELMLHSNKSKLVENAGMESHPGTKIGKFFEGRLFSNSNLYSWYVKGGSVTFKKLLKLGLCNSNDLIPISKDETKQNTVRYYTILQLQLYIQQVLDKNFTIDGGYLLPENITVKDLGDLVRPSIQTGRKRLF